MCAREEAALVTTNMNTHTHTHTQTPGNLVLQAGQAQPWHERMGVKTNSKQNGCIPNESKQLIIYAYWEFLRTEKLQAPSGGLGTGRGQLVSICINNKWNCTESVAQAKSPTSLIHLPSPLSHSRLASAPPGSCSSLTSQASQPLQLPAERSKTNHNFTVVFVRYNRLP